MLQFVYLNSTQHFQQNFAEGPLMIGSAVNDPVADSEPDGCRIVIPDPFVSGYQCSVEFCSTKPDRIRLTNFGVSIALHSGQRIHRGRSVELNLPVFFTAGGTEIQLLNPDKPHALDFALTELKSGFASGGLPDGVAATSPAPQTLASWFDALDALQRSVAGSREFFEQVARAVYNPGGLDGGIVLRPRDPNRLNEPACDDWEIVASFVPYPEYGIQYRADIVNRVAREGRIVYHDSSLIDQQQTIDDLHSCVACPVFDSEGRVVTVVYGFRSQHRTNSRRGIRLLEAQFVQLTAGAISSAMMRMQSEADAARSRILLEQAFSPKVAAHLQSNPGVLSGCEREVSVLFADLRGFSEIAERIGARDTYRLLTDVMDRFSQVVTDHDGVIIDFFGDGLSAFWNAPVDQPDHAHLACQTAIEIFNSMPELNDIWASKLKQRLLVSVGVHTGTALVGNSGSSSRLKYGPQGNTVNIASRIENVTRDVGVPMVVSGDTAAIVDGQFSCRRICRTRLKGIRATTELFQLHDTGTDRSTRALWQRYESALQAFESGDARMAVELLSSIQTDEINDPVVAFLLAQALQTPDQNVGDDGNAAALDPPGPRDPRDFKLAL